MQFSAELLTVHTLRANVLQAERRIARRLAAEVRRSSGDRTAAPEPAARHRRHLWHRAALAG
ncbi:hypothetical protein ACFVTX_09695 [Agromyces sp. NPDC058136]|uniref:hypothetical protein n=1 Tax=Agromyces sp. NPDC058136 TaxID=3346354 RepID=UPI0036DAD3E3